MDSHHGSCARCARLRSSRGPLPIRRPEGLSPILGRSGAARRAPRRAGADRGRRMLWARALGCARMGE
jgi:hypothetical protein